MPSGENNLSINRHQAGSHPASRAIVVQPAERVYNLYCNLEILIEFIMEHH